MITQIVKWGNSLGVRIPKPILEEANININDNVNISCVNNAIVIEKPYSWYEWLKSKIENEMKRDNAIDCSYHNGQVNFAYVSGFITKEQRDELSDMIPEY